MKRQGTGDSAGVLCPHCQLHVAYLALGEDGIARALRHYTSLYGEAVQSGDKRKEACAKGQLAICCYRNGEVEQAMDHFEVALQISQAARKKLLVQRNGQVFPGRTAAVSAAMVPPDICRPLANVANPRKSQKKALGIEHTGMRHALVTPHWDKAKRHGYGGDRGRSTAVIDAMPAAMAKAAQFRLAATMPIPKMYKRKPVELKPLDFTEHTGYDSSTPIHTILTPIRAILTPIRAISTLTHAIVTSSQVRRRAHVREVDLTQRRYGSLGERRLGPD
jgi:hypothetical protein